MERYSEYKDSGVKWLGEIPSHWEVVRIKNVVNMFGRIGFRGYTADDLVEEGAGAITLSPTNIIDGELDFTNCSYLSWNKYYESPEIMIKAGDVVLVKTASVGKCALVRSLPKETTVNPQFLVFKNIVANSAFFTYILQDYIQCFLDSEKNGSTIPTISQQIIGNFKIMLPPRTEQDSIVRYLDAATSKIDKAIAMQQKMIDLLNERKQIIIQNAVTKGLDENVEMKDSSVEWIGMIPKHWEIIKIKHLAKLQSGSNLTSNEISDTGSYPVYGGNGLRGFYGSYNCEGSYVLIGRQGALCGNINYAEDKFWATEHAVVCYPKKTYNTLWFGEVLRLMNLGQYSLASAQPGLAVERIKGLYVPNPSIEEQNKIALFLKQNIGKIDLYARHCQRQIALLQERKQIIINEVVTGKVKVS